MDKNQAFHIEHSEKSH